MKSPIILLACVLIAVASNAQVGIGTTSPNSTLDVQGSLAAKTTVSTSTSNTLGSEFNFIYNGTAAGTVTLPDATTIAGRMYTIKNATSYTLTVNTTSSQTIDGATSYVISTQYQTVTVVSNGTNWYAISGNYWAQGGNTVGSEKKLGTVDNYALPFITNNSEKMRISSTGNVGIGTSTFDATNPEKLLVDAGTNPSSFNLIAARGTKDDYLQLNIQNRSNGNSASSDIVASADNATEVVNYIDMGINSSSYTNAASNILNGINRAYLYATGRDFYVGNGGNNYDLVFFTNNSGTTGTNGTERMRILANGAICMGTNSQNSTNKLTINGTAYATQWNTPSDRRLKTNIGRLKYGLKEIMQLQPVNYSWKNKEMGSGIELGLIAQDTRKIIPEMVAGNEQIETLSINYTELIPVLINAIKEQQQQIEQLKKKVKALENK